MVDIAKFGSQQIDVDDDDEVSLIDLLSVVVENLRLLILLPLVIGVLSLAISFLIRPTFTAGTTFMPPQQQQSSAAMMLQSLGALGGLAGAATGLKNPNDQFVALLKSDSIANELIRRFDLLNRYEKEFKDETRKTLDKRTNVTTGKDGLITVEVDDHEPQFAADLANAYVSELGSLLKRLAITEAQQRRVTFEKQFRQAKDQLAVAEKALGISGLNRSALKSSPEAALKAIAELQAQIAAQEMKVASLRGYLTDSSPLVKQAVVELVAVRGQLERIESTSDKNVLSGVESDYISRYRDVKYYEALFEMFARQFELAKVDEAREGTLIQVVDVALPAEHKSKPKRATIAILTTIATGFLLLLFVFVRERIRNPNSPEESEQKIARLTSAWRRAIGRT